MLSWVNPKTGEVLDYRFKRLSSEQLAFFCGGTFMGYITPFRRRSSSRVRHYSVVPESPLPCRISPVDGFATRNHAAAFLIKAYEINHSLAT